MVTYLNTSKTTNVMPCEMCGKDSERLVKVSIEGTMLNVCGNCSRYGKQIRKPNFLRGKYRRREETKTEENVVAGYNIKIEKARQAKGIKQEDFAKQLNEKESLIHNIETGHMKPNIALAKKIGRALGIELIEEITEENIQIKKEFSKNKTTSKPKNSGVLTIADIIKFKTK